MLSALILAATLGAFPDDDVLSRPKPDLAAYEEATAKSGKNADAHVRLALWCEAHGLTAERFKHLSLAVLYDPTNTLARGLIGLVAYQGKWDRPEVIGQRIRNEPAHQALVREYLDRRARTPDKADAQMKLAAWCAEKGLHEQALAHFSVVTRLDPSRDSAWKHLGYKKQGNRWVKPDEVAAAKQEALQQRQADKHWKTTLDKLREGLVSKDAQKRSKADAGLREVTDPRAVPMVWAVFVRGGERLQIAAVQMLGQIDGPSASNGLAVLAVFSPAAVVRTRAIETLSRRDPRDVVGRLIGLIHKPYKYQVRRVNGPGSPGELFVEGERFNIQRIYQNQTSTFALNQGRLYTPDVPFDPFSIRNLVLATIPGSITDPAAVGQISAGKSVSYPLPISPQSAALAAHAMAANPQTASAIVSQLINNPDKRYAPPGYWFFPSQPNGVGPFTPVPRGQTTANSLSMGAMEAFQSRLEAQNRAAINQLRTTQQNPNNPLHHAAIVNRLENNPANIQDGIALGELDAGRVQAARRDIAIAAELEAIRQANQDLEQRLAMDVHFVETTNEGINLCNDHTLPVLKAITGEDLGVEPEKWKSWWTDQLGYAYQSELPDTKPTYADFVAASSMVQSYVHSACFAAGTLVQTIDGPQPIETIRVGDRVLSQETSTGQLAFHPVVATHRNPPAATLRIAIGGESIDATGIHRFWKAGKGWTMARELKPGDHVRMVGGTVAIETIEADKTQPVYNLDVAQDRDFFVGMKGLLVHDFSFVQPVLEPFDRSAELVIQAPVSK
jgi:tetratricopeptide (TPR) repeat protein